MKSELIHFRFMVDKKYMSFLKPFKRELIILHISSNTINTICRVSPDWKLENCWIYVFL